MASIGPRSQTPIQFPGDKVVKIPTVVNERFEAIMGAGASSQTQVGFTAPLLRSISRENSIEAGRKEPSQSDSNFRSCSPIMKNISKNKRKPLNPQRLDTNSTKRARVSPAKGKRSTESSTSSAVGLNSITNYFTSPFKRESETSRDGRTPGKELKSNLPVPLPPPNVPPLEEKKSLLSEEMSSLQKKLDATEEKFAQTQAALQQAEKQLEVQTRTEDERRIRVAEVLIGTLKELALHQKKEMQRKLVDDRFRIGQVIPTSEGHEIHDIWEPGEDYKILRMKRMEIKRSFEFLQNSRKELRRKTKSAKAPAKGKSDKNDGFLKPEPAIPLSHEILEQTEIYNLRSQSLKKEMADLQQEEERLEMKKQQVIRMQRQIQDERNSKFNDFQILHERYLLLHLMGKGGFSEVYKAFDLEELRYVCCKIHQINESWNTAQKQNYSRHATREYEIQKNLHHSRIVQLHDVFGMTASSFVTVLEFCDGGDLDLLLKKRKILTEREAKSIIMQVFSGLQYLNQQKRKIIHYDLKPANILFHEGQVKLTDFGLSKIMNDNPGGIELTSQGAGTMWYLPPECFVRNSVISSKVDTWSAGVVLFQMVTGQKPFGNGMSQESLIRSGTMRNARKVEFPEKIKLSTSTKEFISRCLSYFPADRPDILEIFSDPYFQSSRKSSSSRS
eukprot:jgi/Bigna1/91569/estExt_fgenesh1_pg.C_1070028